MRHKNQKIELIQRQCCKVKHEAKSKVYGAMMDEQVLGFDARKFSVPDWLQERRHQYLLRPEVEEPFSVDDMVWPKAFCHPRTTDGQRVGREAPQWVGGISFLWDNLSRLTTYLDDSWGMTWQPCQLIAVSVLDGHASELDRKVWDERIVGTVDPAVSKEWDLLGYDIGDASLLSGLMNCGYMPDQEDVQALRDRWAPYLNDHHLFADPQQAADFRVVSNQRVQEHAPFFVYGIYSIPVE